MFQLINDAKLKCLSALTIIGLAAPSTHAADPVPKEFEGLRERWESAMKDLDVPGMAVVVVKDGKIVFTETLGVRDPATNAPVTPDTMFYIASCTKAYMAFAIMTLVDQGKIALDAPVKKYLPKFEIADAKLSEKLTIQDLLSHAKGLNSGPIVTMDAYTGEITEERFYRWLREVKAKGSFQYTNLHFTVLGRVVEAVTGKPWREYLEEQVFKPAGMTRTTGFASRMYGDQDCAQPCSLEGGKITASRLRKSDQTMHAAGGLGTTANDMARWMILNLGQGTIEGKKILSADRTKSMWREVSKLDSPMSRAGRTRNAYGLGWAVGTFQGKRMIEHSGGYVGASAFISFLPDEGWGVAAVVNQSSPMAEIAVSDVYDRLLGTKTPDELPRMKGLAAEARNRISRQQTSFANKPVTADRVSAPIQLIPGIYENPDWGTLTLDLADGKMRATWGGMQMILRSTAKDEFDLDSGSGDLYKGRLEVKAGRVDAVVIIVNAEQKLEARFTPKIGT